MAREHYRQVRRRMKLVAEARSGGCDLSLATPDGAMSSGAGKGDLPLPAK